MKRVSWFFVSAIGLAVIHVPAPAQENQTDEDREEYRRRLIEETRRDEGAPRLGDVAPTFTLKSLDGKEEFELAGFRGNKPVLLIFGSYT